MEARAEERVVYRGADKTEAVRVFGGLVRWKRYGIVEMTSPIGTVSTAVRTGDPARDWTKLYAHDYEVQGWVRRSP